MTHPHKFLIVLVGPTASGKTAAAIRLATHFDTDIISADSRQVYKEIPIGTAAPDTTQLKAATHHFVGQLSIRDNYNVSRFETEVIALLDQLYRKKDAVVMCGGSGLYIDAVCKGIDQLPDPDPQLRDKLHTLWNNEGIEALQQKLLELDPDYYRIVDKHNPKRLMRAIEVCLQTGTTYSALRMNRPRPRNFAVVKIGLEVPRDVLNQNIETRVHQMIRNGWVEEARRVYPQRHLNALNTVGYKELFACFDGEWDLDMAVQKIITNTRRYAKRQMTWFRKDKGIVWFGPDQLDRMIAYVRDNMP